MLPLFDDRGYLPPGVHRCSVDELAERFGQGSPERLVEMSELREFFDWCRQMRITRVLINGSFTTAKKSPNDVDVVILLGSDCPCDEERLLDDFARWPFLHLAVAVDDDDFVAWGTETFGTDRRDFPKGVVEVLP